MASYKINELTTKTVPVAPTGMRSIRLGWKDTRNSKALSSTKYVHVPALAPVNLFDELEYVSGINATKEFLNNLFYDAQDKFIHDLVSFQLENGKYTGELTDEEISLDAMIAESQKSSKGQGKLTKELIKDWFMNDMYVPLGTKVLEQTGMDEVKSEVIMNNYLGYFQKFAGPSFIATVPLAKKLLETLSLCENKNDRVYKALEKKLVEMSVEKTPEDLGL